MTEYCIYYTNKDGDCHICYHHPERCPILQGKILLWHDINLWEIVPDGTSGHDQAWNNEKFYGKYDYSILDFPKNRFSKTPEDSLLDEIFGKEN